MSICFFSHSTLEKADKKRLKLFIESLRIFGGKFQNSPVWIFTSANVKPEFSTFGNIQIIPLKIPEKFQEIFFSPKVFACAQAEEELVCPVYEDVFQYPQTLNGLKAEEPLDDWLKERMDY